MNITSERFFVNMCYGIRAKFLNHPDSGDELPVGGYEREGYWAFFDPEYNE
jgi:hypothetical protein